MGVVLITGSGGLIGSAAAQHFSAYFDTVVGVDNDLRASFFGPEASTRWNVEELRGRLSNYQQHDADIRDLEAMERIFERYGTAIGLVVHTAAQPSHDKAADIPFIDFEVNARGTLNLLELTRQHCPEATFIFTSTNKVYGDRPNSLPLIEHETRWEVDPSHPYSAHGIDEAMSIDQATHSLFGASKVAADILVQEYGRYFGLRTGVFRGGCLTGPRHSGAQLHGFLSYMMKCAMTRTPYTVFGYRGKQVRDNIHSDDLIAMFHHFHEAPRSGAVYNAGGGRHSNCSLVEAQALCEEITGNRMDMRYDDRARTGDHIWYISDTRKFERDYPAWRQRHDLRGTLEAIFAEMTARVH